MQTHEDSAFASAFSCFHSFTITSSEGPSWVMPSFSTTTSLAAFFKASAALVCSFLMRNE